MINIIKIKKEYENVEIKDEIKQEILIDEDKEVFFEVKDDERLIEYSEIYCPKDIKENDLIDVRIKYNNGTDYVVIAKKKLVTKLDDKLYLILNNKELLNLSSAITDKEQFFGTKIYLVKYLNKNQKKSKVNYIPYKYIEKLINNEVVEIERNNINNKKQKNIIYIDDKKIELNN